MNTTPENSTPAPEVAAPSTPDTTPASADVEHVRKVYAKDVKNGSPLNTVFKVADKTRNTARSGKVFLSMTLFDKTGRLEARIFDNVDAAEAAFNNDDYLLVAGKVTAFHGKPQLVVEKLERLDAGPIDAKEFATPPAAAAVPAAAASHSPGPSTGASESAGGRMPKHIRQKLIGLIDDPAISQGIDALVRHLERYIDERVSERLGEKPAYEPRAASAHESSGPRESRRNRHGGGGPKIEHRPKADETAPKAPARDAGLPKDLAFKPFNALAPTGGSETPAADAPASPSTTSSGS